MLLAVARPREGKTRKRNRRYDHVRQVALEVLANGRLEVPLLPGRQQAPHVVEPRAYYIFASELRDAC